MDRKSAENNNLKCKMRNFATVNNNHKKLGQKSHTIAVLLILFGDVNKQTDFLSLFFLNTPFPLTKQISLSIPLFCHFFNDNL